MNLNFPLIMACLALALGVSRARADYFVAVNTDLPEGNLAGLTSSQTVSGLPGSGLISSLSVNLNITGGYNGDLYAYLEAPSGATVTLFNQPGVTDDDPFGYGGSGLNVTLTDNAAATLQSTPETDGTTVTGTYQPVVAFFTLNGQSGNGNWKLFVANVADGGGQSELDNWSLDFSPAPTAAPEPGQTTASALISLAILGILAKRRIVGRQLKKCNRQTLNPVGRSCRSAHISHQTDGVG